MARPEGMTGIQVIYLHLGRTEKKAVDLVKVTLIPHKQLVKRHSVVAGTRGWNFFHQGRQFLVLCPN